MIMIYEILRKSEEIYENKWEKLRAKSRTLKKKREKSQQKNEENYERSGKNWRTVRKVRVKWTFILLGIVRKVRWKMRKAMRKWGKPEETWGKLWGWTNTVMWKCYISDNFLHFSITFLAALLPCCQCFHRTDRQINHFNPRYHAHHWTAPRPWQCPKPSLLLSVC